MNSKPAIQSPEMAPVDYSRKWYVMAAVAMGMFLGTIDVSIVNVAMPTMVRAFGTDFPTVQWVALAYMLTMATLLLSVGRLADMVGKKLLYTIGFVIFTLGSVLCAFSPTVYWLIGFRVLQAVGAAMTSGLGAAIVTEAFPPSERGKALGIGGSIVSIGIIAGPVLGGLLIDALSWHWIFLVNLPIGVVGTLMVIRFVPNFKPAGGQRFDFLGAGTMFVSLMSLLMGLTIGQQIGFGHPLVLGLVAAAVVMLLVFLYVEKRSSQPMIDLSMFRTRLFTINIVTGFITFVSVAGIMILLPFYLQGVMGYPIRVVGLLLGVLPITMGVMAPLAGSLSDRVGPRLITVLGLFLLVIGYLTVSTLSLETTTLGYVLRLLPIGLGMGVFQAPNNSAVMGSVPRKRLGVASSLLSLTRVLGQTVGVAILGALWAGRAVFHAGHPLPDGVTSALAGVQVSALQDTFRFTALLLVAALALAAWGLIQERRTLARQEAAVGSVAANPGERLPPV